MRPPQFCSASKGSLIIPPCVQRLPGPSRRNRFSEHLRSACDDLWLQLSTRFLSSKRGSNLSTCYVIVLLPIGQAVGILTGGIDLSVGAAPGFSWMIPALVMGSLIVAEVDL